MRPNPRQPAPLGASALGKLAPPFSEAMPRQGDTRQDVVPFDAQRARDTFEFFDADDSGFIDAIELNAFKFDAFNFDTFNSNGFYCNVFDFDDFDFDDLNFDDSNFDDFDFDDFNFE